MNTRNRRFRTEISQMSGENKTEWILNAITEIERLDDELKVCRRQIFKLDKKNNELKDENQRLNAQPEMNETVIQSDDDNDDNDDNDEQPLDADTPEKIFTPRKYRERTSTSTPTPR